MELTNIEKVEKEAIRFLDRCKKAKVRVRQKDFRSCTGSRETGALKRAALDLKMVLTEEITKNEDR